MRIGKLFVIAVVASQLGADDCGGTPPPPVLRDPGFDLWCGEALCAWKVVRGDAVRAATWHELDAGVELVGEDAAIQQLSFAGLQFNASDCMKFSLIANVDDAAQVSLIVDVEGDGRIELEQRIPTSHWQPLSFLIPIEGPHDGIRFELAKRGTGSAVLAEIKAERMLGSCDGMAVLKTEPRPNGGSCHQGDQCVSGTCVDIDLEWGVWAIGQCAGCDPVGEPCSDGAVCGVGRALSPILKVPIECVAPASGELGEQCLRGEQCGSGICAHLGNTGGYTIGACSACDPTAPDPCAGCNPSYDHGPFVCDAGGHHGEPGDPCGTAFDCRSFHCIGTERMQCTDGRPCASPANCPLEYSDAELIWKNGACTSVGVQGGRCE